MRRRAGRRRAGGGVPGRTDSGRRACRARRRSCTSAATSRGTAGASARASTSTSASAASIAGRCRGPRLNSSRSSRRPARIPRDVVAALARARVRRLRDAAPARRRCRRDADRRRRGARLPQSGEGIRPAIESGLLAAAAIVEANGDYSGRQLAPYADRLRARFGAGSVSTALSKAVPEGLGAAVGRRLLSAPAFVRHVVLDRWFLHRHQPALGHN